jgi:hypothetical protein
MPLLLSEPCTELRRIEPVQAGELFVGADSHRWSQNGHERSETRRTRRNGHRQLILIKTITWTERHQMK